MSKKFCLAAIATTAYQKSKRAMTDIDMNGGIEVDHTSPRTQLANDISGGAMDVTSMADSTATSRLCVASRLASQLSFFY